MGEVLFYHLTSSPVEQALPDLLERSLARGWRVVVRCGSEPALAMLDAALWRYRDDSFLAHGSAATGHGERQPIWLTCERDRPNGAAVLMLVLGARLEPGDSDEYERVCLIFEGAEAAAVAAAREDWSAATRAGVPARYWAQEDGRWVERARG